MKGFCSGEAERVILSMMCVHVNAEIDVMHIPLYIVYTVCIYAVSMYIFPVCQVHILLLQESNTAALQYVKVIMLSFVETALETTIQLCGHFESCC